MAKYIGRLFDKEGSNIFGPPPCPGVYAVCIKEDIRSKERILYIGCSNNMAGRMLNDRHPYLICYRRFEDKLVYTKSIITDDFKNLEKILIGVYKPLLNKNSK